MTQAGWKPDPNGKHEWRYWDGAAWTDKVSDGGETSVEAYDSDIVPPPPPAAPPTVASTPTPAKRVSYRLVLLDRRNRQIFEAPFQSPDMAMRHADANPELRLKHSVGSVLLRGAVRPNIVRWKTAVIYEIDVETGTSTEYHRMP